MTRKLLLFLFVLMLLLAACKPASSPQATEVPAPTQTSVSEVQVTKTTQVSTASQPGCTVTSRTASTEPTGESLIPPVVEQDWIKGPTEAYVTIIEYGDFQCPSCASVAPVMAQLIKEFPDDVRVIYRHFPLSIHDKAQLATQAAEAAGLQGKFWEMHDLLFETQTEWSQVSVEQFQTWVIEKAGELGLDIKTFEGDLTSDAMVAIAKEAWESNAAMGMPGTPFLMINGQQYNGRMDYANLQAVVKMILLEQDQFTECPPMTLDSSKQYFATIKTENGDIRLELFADIAPLAVNSFIFLANQGWYENVTFHRVIPGFMAQGGDPTGTGFGGPGYAFDNETSPELKFDQAGLLSMANAGPGSNGSQFFITLGPAPHLDGGYTIFGRVLSGMEVVESLAPRDPSQGLGLPPGTLILDVLIEEQ